MGTLQNRLCSVKTQSRTSTQEQSLSPCSSLAAGRVLPTRDLGARGDLQLPASRKKAFLPGRRDNCGCPGLTLYHFQPIPDTEYLPFLPMVIKLVCVYVLSGYLGISYIEVRVQPGPVWQEPGILMHGDNIIVKKSCISPPLFQSCTLEQE